jgi:hypothetical protein
MKRPTPLIIAPECALPGCHHSGDHHTMVKCRSCGLWYCEAHVIPTEASGTRISQVPTVRLIDTGAHGLSYYLGYCMACLDAQAARQAVDSTWLR